LGKRVNIFVAADIT